NQTGGSLGPAPGRMTVLLGQPLSPARRTPKTALGARFAGGTSVHYHLSAPAAVRAEIWSVAPMAVTCRTDVIVIGAGPAGLAAAACCRARGRDYLVVEMGSLVGQRDHADQRGLGMGVGGSGLYSDGKFSFFPSATALWKLPDAPALEESWRWFSSV